MKNSQRIVWAAIFLLCVLTVYGQDWPQYLGPERNSTSHETGLFRSWSEEGPAILWSAEVGIGYGGPVIKDGKVYLLDRDDKAGDTMRCFDLLSGRELWNFGYKAPGSVSFPGSRSVPVVDDSCVYSAGPYGDVYCIDINTHQPVWHKNVWTDFGGKEIPTWAISQCPLVYGDLLILASQAPEAGVVAYEKHSGRVKWKTPSLGKVGYVSPSLVKIDGQDHVVMVTASSRRGGEAGKVVGIHPRTGEILWEFTGWNCSIPVPPAVDAGNNKILVVGGYELGALMIQVEKEADDSFRATELYRTEEFGDQTKPPLFHDGYFYAQYGTNNRRDGMVCMSPEGKIMWKTNRDPDFNKGSMILVDGYILATDGNQTIYLIAPGPDKFKPVAKAELLAEEASGKASGTGTRGGAAQNWAPVAFAGGKLLVRNQQRLICLKVGE